MNFVFVPTDPTDGPFAIGDVVEHKGNGSRYLLTREVISGNLSAVLLVGRQPGFDEGPLNWFGFSADVRERYRKIGTFQVSLLEEG